MIQHVKERHIAESFFWKARLFNLGYAVPPYVKTQFISGIDEIVNTRTTEGGLEFEVDEETGEVRLVDPEPTDDPNPPPVKRNQKAGNDVLIVLDEIAHAIETDEADFNAYEFLKTEVPKSSYKNIRDVFEARLNDLEGQLETYDDETKRYLAGLDPDTQRHDRRVYAEEKKYLQTLVSYYAPVVSACDALLNNAKLARKPRKKKVLSVEKRVSRIQFQKEDTDLKISSIPPSKILGAQELWTYNTKYNFLSVYRAVGEAGLDVKGTSLLDWDEKRSYFKKLGRRPGEHLTNVLGATKARVKRVMEEIKADAQSVNGRLNENTVLLRVL